MLALTLLMGLALPGFCQKEYLFGFGSTQDQVLEQIENHKLLKAKVVLPTIIIASTGPVDVYYQFENGKLNEISMSRESEGVVNARNAFKHYDWFFMAVNGVITQKKEGQNSFSMNAIAEMRSFELSTREVEPGRFRLNIQVTPSAVNTHNWLSEMEANSVMAFNKGF